MFFQQIVVIVWFYILKLNYCKNYKAQQIQKYKSHLKIKPKQIQRIKKNAGCVVWRCLNWVASKETRV